MNKDLFWRHRRCLVAGGFGLIGARVVRRLHALGAEVTVIDAQLAESGANRAQLHDLENTIAITVADVADRVHLARLLPGKQVIFNVIGMPGHLESLQNAADDLAANALAPIALLRGYAEFCPAATLVFASSRQVYGRPRYLPVDENHRLEPLDLNAVHRLTAELYHRRFAELRNLPIRILRFGNTIGPRMRRIDGRQSFLGAWIAALERGEDFEVWGGEQERELLDVEDAVDALLLAGSRTVPNGAVYNIAGDTPITLRNLADQVVENYGGGSFICKEMPADSEQIEIGSFRTSIARARIELGWQPRTSLGMMLQRALCIQKAEL
jgi:UDP-glucose 4-epimerase